MKMKTLLALLLLLAAVLNSEALRCHTCVSASQEECDRQASSVCPAQADACSTITGPNSVLKSCSFRSFCERSEQSVGGVKLSCCYSDDCNGPHKQHSHRNPHNIAQPLHYSTTLLLLTILLTRTAAHLL